MGDIRRRLTQESIIPEKMFSRDPADPSGTLYGHVTKTQYDIGCDV